MLIGFCDWTAEEDFLFEPFEEEALVDGDDDVEATEKGWFAEEEVVLPKLCTVLLELVAKFSVAAAIAGRPWLTLSVEAFTLGITFEESSHVKLVKSLSDSSSMSQNTEMRTMHRSIKNVCICCISKGKLR